MFLNKKRKFQIKLKLAREEYNFLLQGMAVDLYFLKVIIMIKTIIKQTQMQEEIITEVRKIIFNIIGISLFLLINRLIICLQ